MVTGYFNGQELKHLLDFFSWITPLIPASMSLRFRHEVSLRPVAAKVRRCDCDRDGRLRPWLPRDRHHLVVAVTDDGVQAAAVGTRNPAQIGRASRQSAAISRKASPPARA